MEINIIKLEDNKNYLTIETVINGDNKYLFLVEEGSKNNICIRKVIKKDDLEYLVKLENEEEFDEVFTAFFNKYKGEKENEK